MSLREEMWKYEQITGESAEHVPIIKLGAFLDGYEMGLKALEQQLCEDCISRQAVLDVINFEDKWLFEAKSHNADTHIAFSGLESRVKALPSVTPLRPKGKWIFKNDNIAIPTGYYQCSECEEGKLLVKDNYCPNCGAEMSGGEEE